MVKDIKALSPRGNIPLPDMKFGFPRGMKSYTESRIINFYTPSGCVFYVQFVYSYVTWSPSLNFSLMIHDPEHKENCFQTMVTSSNLVVSESDQWSFTAKGISMSLEGKKKVTLEIDIKEVKVNGTFTLDSVGTASPLADFQVDYHNSASNKWDGYFCPGFKGSVNIQFFGRQDSNSAINWENGHAVVSHSIQTVKPWIPIGQLTYLNFHSADEGDSSLSFVVHSVTSPHALSRAVVNLGTIMLNRDTIGICDQVHVEHPDGVQADPNTKCPIPKTIRITAHGKIISGSAASVPSTVALEDLSPDSDSFELVLVVNPSESNVIARLNVLDNLPGMIREVVKRFMKNPYVYRYLEDVAQVHLTIYEGPAGVNIKSKQVFKGKLFNELAFVEY